MNSEKHRILIGDTDQRFASQLADALSKENYEVRVISDFSGSSDPIDQFRPHFLIFDPLIKKNDPYLRLHKYHCTYSVPVLVVSKNDDVISKVISLEMGADDYLVKPFDMRELKARVHALLRRSFITHQHVNPNAESVEYPDLEISLKNYTVSYKGQILPMPPKEIELLYFLASSPNRVFSREQLLSHIWGYDYAGDTRTVDVHIKRLRRKLPATDAWSIATVWGVGYKFQFCS